MNIGEIISILSFWIGDKKPGLVVTKEDYERLLHLCQLRHLKKKIGLPEEYQPGQPIPRQVIEISKMNTVDIAPFKRYMGGQNASLSVNKYGIANLPSDYYYPSALQIKLVRGAEVKMRDVKILSDKEYSERTGSFIRLPNLYFPIANFQNGFIMFSPKNVKYADFWYIAIPEKPVYAVTYTHGYPQYNSSASTELAWNETNTIDIMVMVLGELGINMTSSDIIQIAEKSKITGQ